MLRQFYAGVQRGVRLKFSLDFSPRICYNISVMKKSVIAVIAAAAVAAACVPVFSGCSASAGYELKTDGDEKYYCASLTGYSSALKGELVIPAYYGEGENRYPVKEIAAQGFSGTSVTKIVIPSTVEIIGDGAFIYSGYLEEVVFEEGSTITAVPWGMCGGCSLLKRINIPDSVTEIEGMAFTDCASLESIALPPALTAVKMSAFEGCSSLKNIVFPETLVSIGARAFYNCTSLEELVLPDGMHSVVSTAKDENGEDITETTPALGYAAFHTCTALKSVVVGDGITEISEGAFGYCSSLETVYLPSGLLSVKGAYFSGGRFVCGHAFHHDGNLKNVNFAGTAEEWENVRKNSDTQSYSSNGAVFDNSAIFGGGADVRFGVKYGS